MNLYCDIPYHDIVVIPSTVEPLYTGHSESRTFIE